MHTVDLLEQALAAAERIGYRVRQDWLDGRGGGCEIKGQKWILLDLASSPAEKLQVVAEVLSQEAPSASVDLSPPLRGLLDARRAA